VLPNPVLSLLTNEKVWIEISFSKMKRSALVKLVPSADHCFVAVPSSWASHGSVWRLKTRSKQLFFSVHPRQSATDDHSVEIGSAFAACCGVRADDVVECTAWTSPVRTCDSLTVLVTRSEEYELVSTRAHFLEADLLSRLAVVAPSFPVWLGQGLIVQVEVDFDASGVSQESPWRIGNNTRLLVGQKATPVVQSAKQGCSFQSCGLFSFPEFCDIYFHTVKKLIFILIWSFFSFFY
jgi:hypothetical protein